MYEFPGIQPLSTGSDENVPSYVLKRGCQVVVRIFEVMEPAEFELLTSKTV